jgi:beta-lactamase regulating signal transducer with metallopeptidase domain/Leucine-rich repeat (LRR) protein
MESLLTQIANYLLAQSWQIAILTIVIAFISLILKNKNAHIRYLLWMIVLAKCLIPPLYTISIAILPEKEITAFTQTPPVMETVTYQYNAADIAAAESPEPAAVHFETRALLAIGWLIGAAALSFYYLVNALRTQVWLQKRRKELPGEYKKNIESLFASYGVRRMPRLWLLDKINQPFVWGLVRGSIYLPAELINQKHTKFHTSLIGHEISHVLRLDALINSLQVITQIIFWFHPFIWWTNRKIRSEREKCCDETTIARQNALPAEYSEAIVEILAAKYEQARKIPSLAVAGKVKNIEERIKTMLRPGKKFYKRPSIVAALAILFIALIIIPTALVLTVRAQTEPTTSPSNKSLTNSNNTEQPRYAARTFNSKLELDVYYLLDVFYNPATAKSDWTRIGRTPSVTPLEIPPSETWGVYLYTTPKDWDELEQEINQNKIPWLSLYYPVTDSDLSYVSKLKDLNALDVLSGKLTDAGLEHLKNLKDLEGIYLEENSPQITNAGLSYLQGLTNLKALTIESPQITDAGITYLENFTVLEELGIFDTKITDAGLVHIQKLTKLKRLYLNGNKITDAGLAQLKNLSVLWELRLANTQVTDAGMVYIKNMTGIRRLNLGNTKVTDAGFEQIKDLTQLQFLTINGSQITDAGLANFKDFTGMQFLVLGDTNITDKGLEYLRGMINLERLYLQDTKITDAGLEFLKGMINLRRLYVQGTKVTVTGILQLKKSLPALFTDINLPKPATFPGLVKLTGGMEIQAANNTADPRHARVEFIDSSLHISYPEGCTTGHVLISNQDYATNESPDTPSLWANRIENGSLRYFYCASKDHLPTDNRCELSDAHADYYYGLVISGGKVQENGAVVFPAGSNWVITKKTTGRIVDRGTLSMNVTYQVIQ